MQTIRCAHAPKQDGVLFSYVIHLKVDETGIAMIFHMQLWHGGTKIMNRSDLVSGAHRWINEKAMSVREIGSLQIIRLIARVFKARKARPNHPLGNQIQNPESGGVND